MHANREVPRRALALAGGGITGGLYEIGALLALDELFENFTTCDFDLYVGTSAGAFVASLLANRVSPARLRDTIEGDRRTLPRLAGSQFLSVPWARYLETVARATTEIPQLARHVWDHWRDVLLLDTVGSLSRLLPHGLFTVDGLEAYVRQVLVRSGRTNDFGRLKRKLLIPATVLDTGAINVFGLRRHDPTPISRAVAASAAVPFLFEPVNIDGVDYVDGAVAKTAHTRLAVERGARLVVLINPVRPFVPFEVPSGVIRRGGPFSILGQSFRIMLHRRLQEGLRRHAYEHPETDIVMLEPTENDPHYFDTPLMTYSLRTETIRRAYRSTIQTILDDFERYAALFARHGIRLVARSEIERRAKRAQRLGRAVA